MKKATTGQGLFVCTQLNFEALKKELKIGERSNLLLVSSICDSLNSFVCFTSFFQPTNQVVSIKCWLWTYLHNSVCVEFPQ